MARTLDQLTSVRLALAEMEEQPEVEVVPEAVVLEEEVLGAWSDGTVGIRGPGLYHSSALVDCRHVGELTIVLRPMVWRRRTVCVAEGSWSEGVRAKVGCRWQARYRDEHSAWRDPAIGDIAAQSEVPSFFGHFKDGDDGIKNGLEGRREQKEVFLCKKWGRNSDKVVLADGS